MGLRVQGERSHRKVQGQVGAQTSTQDEWSRGTLLHTLRPPDLGPRGSHKSLLAGVATAGTP